MKLQLLFALPALLLASLLSHSQTYEPGLLVRSTGDTLRGEIENGFWVEPPAFIHFRTGPAAAVETLKPRRLRAVLFTNGRYFRYVGLPIDHAAETRLEALQNGYATNIKLDSLLAEVLVEGPVALLRVVRPGSLHLLLQRAGQPMLDLCSRQYLRQTKTGGWAVTDGNNYHNQLALYLVDCPAASRMAETAEFTAAGLSAVVQVYNQTCSPAGKAGRSWLGVAAPRRRVSIQGGIVAGVRYNHLTNRRDPSTAGCTDCNVHPFGGLYMEMLLPGRRTAVYTEFSLGNFSNTNYYIVSTLNSDYTYTNSYGSYGYSALLGTARIGVRYFFPLPHEQQIIFGVNYELSGLWNTTITRQPSPAITILESELTYPTVPLVPSLTLGWRIRRFSVAADAQSWFTGEIYVLRGHVTYRLGRNHDVKTPAPTSGEGSR